MSVGVAVAVESLGLVIGELRGQNMDLENKLRERTQQVAKHQGEIQALKDELEELREKAAFGEKVVPTETAGKEHQAQGHTHDP